jgi:hypothetical protein
VVAMTLTSADKSLSTPPSLWKSLTQTDTDLIESASALFFIGNELKRVVSSSKSQVSLMEADLEHDDYGSDSNDGLPKRWVDFFCIVGLDEESRSNLHSTTIASIDNSDNTTIPSVPTLLDSYPLHRPDMEFPPQLPAFCFPTGCHALLRERGKTHNIPEPSLCQLVLTSAAGNRLYLTTLTVYEQMIQADQRVTTNRTTIRAMAIAHSLDVWIPKCLILLSHYPFFHEHSTILKELYYSVTSGASPIPFERFVAHIVSSVPFPKPLSVVEWKSWTGPASEGKSVTFCLDARRHQSGATSLEPLFRTISLSNILVVWATLLQEGKVVLQCSHSNVSLLTPICEALLLLLFPLEWKGIYIPALPASITNNRRFDILDAPIPYLIGFASNPKEDKLPHPPDVIWCDLDNDILHLGYNEDGTVVQKLPVIPERSIMRLKIHLEELADPLYLPSANGIKGEMTTGDRSGILENSSREVYAQRTRLFDKPSTHSFSRSYILSQSSKVPPRGKPIQTQDFVISKEEPTQWSDLICCLSDIVSSDHLNGNAARTVELPEFIPDEVTVTKNQGNDAQNPFMASLARSSRHVQAHADRLLAVFGNQEFATPSSHASKACSDQQFGKDALKRQDEIAQHFFETTIGSRDLFEKVHCCFMEFFVSAMSRYEFYVDPECNRLDVDKFLRSSGLPKQQQVFVWNMLTSQMFNSFLYDSRRRRLFDAHIRLSQQRANRVQDLKKTSSPILVLTVPPPCGLDVRVGTTYCHDRRFPDILSPEELITESPTGNSSLWNLIFSGTRSGATNKSQQRHKQKKSQLYHFFSPSFPWFVSLLCAVVGLFYPSWGVASLSPCCVSPKLYLSLPRTELLYQSSMVQDEPFIPLNHTQRPFLTALDHLLKYDYQQADMCTKKFNADLHDVAFRRHPLLAHSLLKTMERLYQEDPTNSSLVQPDSLAYTTVIESWCQTTRSRKDERHNGSASAPKTWFDEYGRAALAAQDLLFSMERLENLMPSPLNYLFVCQRWAEIDDSSGKSMRSAENIFATFRKKVEDENFPSVKPVYPESSLAAFYAVLIKGWSSLVGRVDGAFDRAEALLNEFESACSSLLNGDHDVACVEQEKRENSIESHRDVGPFSLAYTSFIVGISRSNHGDMGQRADAILKRMKEKGVSPDMVVYTSVLNCWAKASNRAERVMASCRALQLLKEVEDRYLSEGNYLLKPNQITYSQVIKAIGHSQDPNAPRLAEDIMRRMYQLTESGMINVPPNVHIYNAVITTFSGGNKDQRAYNAREAERLLYEMVHQSRLEGNAFTEPSVVTLGIVLRAWAESGLPDCGQQAQRVLDHFEARYDAGSSRVRPNVVCYTTVMQAWGRSKAPPHAALQKVETMLSKLENLYTETGHESLRPNQITYITVMDVYSRKCPNEAGAMSQALVDRLSQLQDIGLGFEKPSRIIFNKLINTWSKSAEANAAENAERVFQRMEAQYAAGDGSARPDEVSLCCVLNAWANNAFQGGALRAQQIMDYTTKELTSEQRGFDHTVVSWNVLVKAWGRSRAVDSVQRAERILVDLETRYRKGRSNVKPDITTYSSVINCCAYYNGPSRGRSPAFEVALRTFQKIKQSDDLVANNIVYGTMLKAIGKLQKPGQQRDVMIKELFVECMLGGQVCSFVLVQLKSASRDLFQQLVLDPCALKDQDATDFEDVWRKLPKDWKRSVVL